MFRRALLLSTCLALGAATSGCMDFKSVEGDQPISTHVADWRDEVIYQIMVDRFADGDRGNDYRVDRTAPARYHGGDWLGIEDHLGYLQHLGVTALWISPIVKNVETDAGVDGYHGYWAQDFTQLNPHFGNLAALRNLVKAAHDRGMKVILDIVVNHLGQLFYYDINLNGQPDESVRGEGPVVAPDGKKTLPDGTPIGTSIVSHINEYDPDYDPRGVQAWTFSAWPARLPSSSATTRRRTTCRPSRPSSRSHAPTTAAVASTTGTTRIRSSTAISPAA